MITIDKLSEIFLKVVTKKLTKLGLNYLFIATAAPLEREQFDILIIGVSRLDL